jgi:hypothetical protein
MKTVFRLALLSFLSALILSSCASSGLPGPRQAWQPPRPVALEGGAFWNLMRSPMTVTTSLEDYTGGLLVRDGDVVAAIGEDFYFVYKQSDGTSLEMSEEYGRLILSGQTVSIDLADNEDGWEWLDQASPDDLRSLRFLILPEDPDESGLSTLRRLADANPNLGLGISGTRSFSSSMPAAALFKPRILFLESSATAPELSEILAGQNRIETLIFNAAGVENLDFLTTLPNLHQVVILNWDPATTGPLPKGMRALKSLLLMESALLDASALAAVPEGIQELSLVGCDNITSFGGLERFSNLRTLILSGSPGNKDLSILGGMKNLAWVGLPPGTTQEQFSAFIGEHLSLKIVELNGCSEITDLSPLQRLTGLTGLVASPLFGRPDAVYQLKSLEFLGLATKVFNDDPDEIARIREALPRALVVPVCLGSGWILLVIPLAALIGIAGSRARRRTSPQSADR